MSHRLFTTATALLISAASTLSAQTPAQTTPRAADTQTSMRLVGCLVNEVDYRKMHNQVALTNVGLGDEFVLVDVESAASSTPPPASGSTTSCAERGSGQAYRLTGKMEEELKRFVGRRIEITGHFQDDSDVKAAADPSTSKMPAQVEIVGYQDMTAPSTRAAAAPVTAPRTPASVEARNEPVGTSFEPRQQLSSTASTEPLILLLATIALLASAAIATVRRFAR